MVIVVSLKLALLAGAAKKAVERQPVAGGKRGVAALQQGVAGQTKEGDAGRRQGVKRTQAKGRAAGAPRAWVSAGCVGHLVCLA